jgi:hypothetical protein
MATTATRYVTLGMMGDYKKKGKAVPLHAMEAYGGRGGIARINVFVNACVKKH